MLAGCATIGLTHSILKSRILGIHTVKFRPYHKEVTEMLYLMHKHDNGTANKKVRLSRQEKRDIKKLFRRNRKNHELYLTFPGCIAAVVRSLRHRTPTLHLYH